MDQFHPDYASTAKEMNKFSDLISNYINAKSLFLPKLETPYEVEQHYYGRNFKNNYEMMKKIIYDFTTEKDYVEYEIIVKKKRKTDFKTIIIQKPLIEKKPFKTIKNEKPEIEHKKMHRHKNCPKLFGKTFFNLVIGNIRFKKKHVTNEILNMKAKEIAYPNNFELNLTQEEFVKWVQNENYHTKYTNLKVFRDVWNYKSAKDCVFDKDWLVKHYKYILTQLMKIFFEEYAYNYVMKSNIMNENGEQYLNLIPKFIQGMENPTTFLCLLD